MSDFALKKDMEARFKVLRAHVAGQGGKISEGDPAFDELLGMFQWHHNFAEKAGPGVLTIATKRNLNGNLEFWFDRVDGSSVDISFTKTVRDYVVPKHRGA